MTKKQKITLARIITAAITFAVLIVAEQIVAFEEPANSVVKWAFYGFSYALVSYDIIFKALKNISHGQIFDENFLMTLATAAAWCIGELSEAVAVMLLYQTGELFQSYAVGKSRKSISDIMDICPEYANVEQDGELKRVEPDEVETGSIIVIKPGERIPLDGVVVEGDSLVDTSALTGESAPRRVTSGSEVISGCINKNATLKVRVTKPFDDSTVSKILELLENAAEKKADTERFITKFARIYTPFVTVCALILALAGPIILGGGWYDWVKRACIFLIISCPCALVISVPLSFFGGIGAASKIGVLVKGGNYLESMGDITAVIFDKTGTLTLGEFKVSEIKPVNVTQERLLELAAHGEICSNHPIAYSIREAYKGDLSLERTTGAAEVAGEGTEAFVDGKKIYVGNARLMSKNGIEYTLSTKSGTVVYVAYDGEFIGHIVISDVVKTGAGEAIKSLKSMGVKRCVMLTGDSKKAALSAAEQTGIDEVYADLLPQDKVDFAEKLLLAERKFGKTAFVGDGINDAPVLSAVDVGIAMGSMGQDAAIEAADVVIMDDDIGKISACIRIARKTMGIVKLNIIFALLVKAVILTFGAFGLANMWIAIFGDVGVAVIAILNAMRTLRIN